MPNIRTEERILLKGATVLTMDPRIGDFPIADILVEGSTISAVGVNLRADGASVRDFSGRVVMPGFVNAHQHAWLGLLRGLLPNVDTLDGYMEAIPHALGRHYRPEDMHVSTLLTSLSCIDGGVTTFLDACHNARSPEHTDAAIDALQAAGIRCLHTVGKPLSGDWAQHWPKDIDRLKSERFASNDGLVQLGLFAQADKANWAVARRHGLRILTEFMGSMAGILPAYHGEGLLGSDNVFNHCTQLNADQWRILADAGVNVTVNPRSDALFGLETHGFPYQDALDHGLRPALGIDIDTSMSGDMFGEMRAAFFQQRMVTQARRSSGAAAAAPVKVRALLEAATIDGARALGLADRIGSITPGKQADIIAVRTDGVGVAPSHNAIGNIVHMVDRSAVEFVMVGGRARKDEGRLIDVDFDTVRHRGRFSEAAIQEVKPPAARRRRAASSTAISEMTVIGLPSCCQTPPLPRLRLSSR